ncbi:MAG TPA: DUF2807 domain-containing protein [Sphingomicrobium sp.]|nr:DUF2807 domain-containing protein [Sphingomicrobium sp.]
MRIVLSALAILAATAATAAPAGAATRNFGVSGFDRVRVDGPFKVRLATGVAPFAVATGGSAAALDPVVIEVQGRTLVVRTNRSSWGGYPGVASGPVEISIGTHDLSAAWLNGSGSLAIDKARGLSFDLSVQGAGSASIAAVAVDHLKVAVSGTASASLAGTAPRLTAIVRGISTLDAEGLVTRDATIGADGPATVRVTVTNGAKIDAHGTATIGLAGRPACTVKASGSASVSGCR